MQAAFVAAVESLLNAHIGIAAGSPWLQGSMYPAQHATQHMTECGALLGSGRPIKDTPGPQKSSTLSWSNIT